MNRKSILKNALVCRQLLIMVVVLLFVFLFAKRGVLSQENSDSELTEQQTKRNVDSFDYVWQTVRDQYWDASLGGLDWSALKEEIRPKVVNAKTNAEARQAIRELVNSFNVSHFAIIPAEVYQKIDQQKPSGRFTTGMDVRIVDDHVIVTQIEPGSPAEKLGIKTGWEIIRIGDVDIVSRYKEISKELKDHPHRRTILVSAAKSRLYGKSGEKIEVTFVDGMSREKKVSISLIEPRGKKAKFGHIPEFFVWIDVRKLEGNVGYIRFNAFMDPAYLMPKFNQAMIDFQDADGIIIDVRGNGGGLGEMGTAMMGWLLKTDRQQMGTVILRETRLKMFVHPRANPYKGRVAVLIDEMSISAAEFFASGINDLELARLIGTRTAGAALGSSIEKLPNGDGFQFPRANYVSKATGKTLEGVGVHPHQEVHHQRDALLEGRDLQMDAAVEWIKNKQ